MPCSMHPCYDNPAEIYSLLPVEKQGGKYAEAALYNFLKGQLPDNWFVVYSVFFQGEHRPHEMDFLVLVPGKGFVYLECKGRGYRVENGGKDFIFDANPQQDFSLQERHGVIKNFANNIKEHFFWDKPYPPFYGYAVIFPTVDIELNGSSTERPHAQRFDFRGLHVYTRTDLQQEYEGKSPLQQIIEDILNKSAAGRETYFQRDEAQTVFDHYAAQAHTTDEQYDLQGDAFNRRLEDIFEGAQENPCTYILSEGAYKYIEGAAGTGKTWIAIEAAKRFAKQYRIEHPGKQCRILYVCYNTLLAAEIDIRNSDFKELSVANFHRLEQVCLGTQPQGKQEQFDEKTRDQEIHDRLAEALAASSEDKRLKKFDMILVDEAQDFNRGKIETLCMLAKSQNRKMVFFADSEQTIHQPQRENQNPIFLATGETITPLHLQRVIRNSGNIQRYAAELVQDEETVPIRADGPEVSIIDNATYENVQNQLRMLLETVPPSRIAVLWDALRIQEKDEIIKSQLKQGQKYAFLDRCKSFGDTKKNLKIWHDDSKNSRYIWATSLQKFKGLEAPYILLLKGTDTPVSPHYVGATRAKYRLFVFQMG